MRLEKIFRIPPRVRRLGLLGLLLVAALAILRLAGEAILEQEVQKWWEGQVKPLLFSPTSIAIQFNIYGWIIMAIAVLLTIGVGGAVYAIAHVYGQRDRTRKLLDSLRTPSNLDSTELTPTDVVNAILDAKRGTITPEFLVDEIAIKAVNSNVIRPQAAAETLEEFGFELILRSDGTWSYTKRKERGGER